MNILITGQSGTGKSTVLKELESRGYTTYNTDDFPEVTRLEYKETGEVADWPEGFVDWDKFAWNWQKSGLTKLLNSSEVVFIGAVTSNQEDYYHFFDKIIVLVVGDEELYDRRIKRTTHIYSNNKNNVAESVKRNKANTKKFILAGGLPVNNNRPIPEVVDEILNMCGL